ncbi:hypothetical protein JKP88DRAFT_31089 [Tribonema minus]|uniref:Uncharacterized protein n=1 Tax=Tribonema minus TaxID=303371 RepID=A0A835Z5V9_9STRA|nr:hypothetical protein JKP88DRAFT_31089 [Tribonema minus]
MPYFTVCRPFGPQSGWWDGVTTFKWNVDCTRIGGADGNKPCEGLEQPRIRTAAHDSCVVIHASEDIAVSVPAVGLEVSVTNTSTYDQFNSVTTYLTDFEPTAGMDWDADLQRKPYDFRWFRLGARHTAKVTQQTVTKLNASYSGLRISPSTTRSFSLSPAYFEAIPAGAAPDDASGAQWTLTIYLRADSLGVDEVVETDPVDWFTLMGTIAGFFNYVLLAFGVLVGKSMLLNMKRLEDKRIHDQLDLRLQVGAGLSHP